MFDSLKFKQFEYYPLDFQVCLRPPKAAKEVEMCGGRFGCVYFAKRS